MTSTWRDRNRDGRRPATAALVGVVAAVLLLSACKTSRYEIVGAIPDDYRINHPIIVAENLVTLDVPVGADTPYLTADASSNIMAFADSFRQSGAAAIAIVAPSGSDNEAVAAGMARQVARVLVDVGIPETAIDRRSYAAEPGETEAPLRLAFPRIEAKTAPCGPWQDDMGNTFENRHYSSFGCASQANLAAMVANPMDLVHPRRVAPADAARRSAVLNNYRTGAPTQSDHSKEAGSDVAQGVGN